MTYQDPGDHQRPQYPHPQPYQDPQQYQAPQQYQDPQRYQDPQQGYRPQQAYPPPGYGGYPLPVQGNGIATAGLVCGIIAVVLCWVPVIGWILAILGIVFGGVGMSRASKGAPNKGQAVAGVVLGIVSLLLYIFLVAVAYNSLY